MMMFNNSSGNTNETLEDLPFYDGSIDLDAYFSNPMVAIQVVLSLLIFGSNGFFLVVFIKRKALREKPSNILLLSFALCDIMFGALIMLHINSVFVADHTMSTRKIELRFLVILDILGNAVNCCSVFHLGLIAGERFISLFAPLKHLVMITRRRIIISLLTIWALAFCFPWFELCYLYRVLDGDVSVKDSVALGKSQPIYSIFSWTVFTLLPMIFLAVIYIKMLLRIRRTLNSRKGRKNGDMVSFPAQARVQSDSKAIGIFACMYIMFFALSMPYFAARVLFDTAKITKINVDSLPPTLLKVLYFLRCIVSFLNPLLYTGWKADVRKEALILCSRRIHRHISRLPTGKARFRCMRFRKFAPGIIDSNTDQTLKGDLELCNLQSTQKSRIPEEGHLLKNSHASSDF